MPMVQSRQQLVARVRGLFDRYGLAAIMVGYHIGPPRALVTSIAGIAGMPRLKFESASIVSATVWIVDHVLIGAIPGTFIDADGPWLLPVTLLAPVVTIVLTVILLRKAF
jgi:membrane protein DedA with SNARE-associated domain